MSQLDRLAELDRFIVQQQFAMFLNKYTISMPGSGDSSDGEPLAYVQQKRMKIREEVLFWPDESQSSPLMRIKAKKVFEFRGRSDVQLPDGTVIGQLQKVFGKSLFRSTWQILDAGGNVVGTAQESSLPRALFRRFYELIPYVGAIPLPIPFHFDIAVDGHVVGKYRRIFSWLDRYEMDLSGDTARVIDRRVAMAFAIALDALQDR